MDISLNLIGVLNAITMPLSLPVHWASKRCHEEATGSYCSAQGFIFSSVSRN